MTEKMIGILGGMGPEATVDFVQKIVAFTDAPKDSDHIPIIVYNNPKIPDRSRAILENGPSPLPMLKEGALFLQESGADIIVMPCITAHLFYSDLIKCINVPILHLIEASIEVIHCQNPLMKKLGLLATAGTYKTGIWNESAQQKGIQIVTPEESLQELLMEAIYGEHGIKAGYKTDAAEKIFMVIEHLKGMGAEAVVLGCTELSLVRKIKEVNIPIANPLVIGSRIVIERMGYPLSTLSSPGLIPC